MNNLKTNPVGRDVVIHRIQTLLYDRLSGNGGSLWNGVQLDGYPRCYPLEVNDGNKGINFFSADKEYQNLIHAEKNKFFFTAEDPQERTSGDYFNTEIELFFILNLKQVKPDVEHLADEEVIADVYSVVSQVPGINIQRVITDQEEVFAGYDYQITDDMHPYKCFKMEIDVFDYQLDDVLTC
jgi:hypothetical protein